MFYPAQAVPLKTCLGDQLDYGAPFHGEWPSELSQNSSSVLELPTLAEALMTPKAEFGPWGYPSNDPRIMSLMKSGQEAGAELDFAEDIVLTDGPISKRIEEQQAAAAADDSSSPVLRSSFSIIVVLVAIFVLPCLF